ncbi:Methyltransferase domain-containing protein [Alteribacillus persepolensis]|uniref:Methyltransferase domain-containing protein n=1 Tax=Alteribacillus persepolensis TaxID=568899 RepID=A0A1G7ZLA6_9BACI|nr:class I SAM-dependent methyltransferase [Alteribacillus persepolensis]SDH09468.1 Methyltransferase domain-containing protein [Alteribacillus persepolensis]
MKAWFEEHFQEDYLRIYDHRDEEKAASELSQIMSYLPLEAGMKAIDLCCGNGRHARWLARKGLHVTGVDLSPALLKKAIDLTSNLPVQYQRSDIRDVPLLSEYDVAFNLFTSFGYFTDDAENELVFTRATEALRSGGWFCFDYLNPSYVRNHLVPEDESVKDGLHITQKREMSPDFVYKKITIQENDMKREYQERVKLYEQPQLMEMLKRNQFDVLHVFGDYDASRYEKEESPRQIFICQKK